MVKWMISVSFTDKNITTGSCTIKLWFQVSISLNIVWNVWNVIILCCCTACINSAQRSSPNRKKNHIMMSIFCPWKGCSLHSGEFRLHVICSLYSNSVCVCVCWYISNSNFNNISATAYRRVWRMSEYISRKAWTPGIRI